MPVDALVRTSLMCKQLFVDTQTFSNRANNCVWTRKHFQTVQTIVCEQRKDLLLVDAPTWFPRRHFERTTCGFSTHANNCAFTELPAAVMVCLVLSPSCLLLVLSPAAAHGVSGNRRSSRLVFVVCLVFSPSCQGMSLACACGDVLSPSCLLLSWCAWCFHRAACCLCFHPPPPRA